MDGHFFYEELDVYYCFVYFFFGFSDTLNLMKNGLS